MASTPTQTAAQKAAAAAAQKNAAIANSYAYQQQVNQYTQQQNAIVKEQNKAVAHALEQAKSAAIHQALVDGRAQMQGGQLLYSLTGIIANNPHEGDAPVSNYHW
jgi:hypothetical protein